MLDVLVRFKKKNNQILTLAPFFPNCQNVVSILYTSSEQRGKFQDLSHQAVASKKDKLLFKM